MKFGVIGLDEKRPSDSIEVPTQWALLIMSMHFPGANIIQNDGIFETIIKISIRILVETSKPTVWYRFAFLGVEQALRVGNEVWETVTITTTVFGKNP